MIRLPADVSRIRADRYLRVHELRQINNRVTLSSERVLRADDGPMEWEVKMNEPHTRYALRWTIAS